MSAQHPVSGSTRIESLDIIRGVAVLGILIMNIQSFAMPTSAYFNPTVFGDLNHLNLLTWLGSHLIADSKFMAIFSMLFGVGICIFSQRAERKAGHPAVLHYRRMFFLLAFGLVHAHFIWYGDILVGYALCGCWVYFFRHVSVKTLLMTALILLLIPVIYNVTVGLYYHHIPLESQKEIMQFWFPSIAEINHELQSYLGSFSEQMAIRSQEALLMETSVFVSFIVWRAGGLMLLGMALFKTGFFNGSLTANSYTNTAIAGLSIGLLLTGWGITQNFSHQWSVNYSMFIGTQYNYFGSIFSAIAYVALINLMIKKGWFHSLQTRLAAVGRMAFSNYIAQSVIGTFIFYGWGLGWFGQIERAPLLIIVLLVWLIQLAYSPWWLARFYFGPLEWCWRSLSYMQWQPLRRV